MRSSRILVIAIYSHPDYYPPTLNAVECLAQVYEKVYIVHRNITGFSWKYPDNVELLKTGESINVREAEKKSFFYKLSSFFRFSRLLAATIRKTKAHTLLIYDYMPLLSYRLFRFSIPRPAVLWYHNHDVADPTYLRKYSLSWQAWKTERRIFPELSLFSLPALERKVYFPIEKLKGRFFFLPNFPARMVYGNYNTGEKKLTGDIRILYQGSIGTGHGIEEIIAILNTTIEGRGLNLVLKGFVSEVYKNELLQLAEEYRVKDRIHFLPPTDYSEVIRNAFTCHIGIGIHKKQDIMNKTLGTASNKIYEYMAAGMPVLIYDNDHFRSMLRNRRWAFFTDTSRNSLIECLQSIISDYPALSKAALSDFESEFNFEHYFHELLSIL